MADIAIQMGVNAPSSDVNGVLTILNYIYQQDPSTDDTAFRFNAYEEDFGDGAIGVLASMSVTLNYVGHAGEPKTYTEHLLQSFERNIEDNAFAFAATSIILGHEEADYRLADMIGDYPEVIDKIKHDAAPLMIEYHDALVKAFTD